MTLAIHRIRELLNPWYPQGGTFVPFERPDISWTPSLEELVEKLALQKTDEQTVASAISMYRPALESHEMIDVALAIYDLIEAELPERNSNEWNQILRPTAEEWSVKEQKRLDYFNGCLESALTECQEYATDFAALSEEGMATYIIEKPHPGRWAALTRHCTSAQKEFLDSKILLI
jgi:hypothetical protein